MCLSRVYLGLDFHSSRIADARSEIILKEDIHPGPFLCIFRRGCIRIGPAEQEA